MPSHASTDTRETRDSTNETRDSTEPRELFVVFGAMGDLSQRKLLPSLVRMLRRHGGLDRCGVLGIARRDVSEDAFRQRVLEATRDDDDGEVERWTESNVFLHRIAKRDPDYGELARRIRSIEGERQLSGNRTFYLAIAPQAFGSVVELLGSAGLNRGPGETRLVIEKPFGHDLASARRLNEVVHEHFDEPQVFRIDHFLAKTTVQNLLVLRFGNVVLESMWNRDRIDRVEITAAETMGIGDRAGYYDRAGALRDMVQNHLTQLLTLVGMEAPSTFEAEQIRREKLKVLESVAPIDPRTDAVYGQYAAGRIDDDAVPGYRDEPNVDDDSETETFAAVRLHVDNWRWAGVPFYLCTGKRMRRASTRIAITLRCAPAGLFRDAGGCAPESDRLVITLKPDEGFDLTIGVRRPQDTLSVEPQSLRFRYDDTYGRLPDAYETLLHDVMTGDQTTFVHASEAEAAWRVYAPLLADRPEVVPYPAGSWGPTEAGRLIGSSPAAG